MRKVYFALFLGAASLCAAPSAHAQGIPEGDYVLQWADWMAIAYVVAFTAAWVCFLVAAKWGILGDVEKAKYYMLTIDEPDYYSSGEDKEVGKNEPIADTTVGR